MKLLLAVLLAALGTGCFVFDELDHGDELMDQLGPGKKTAEPAPAKPAPEPRRSERDEPGWLDRLGGWWREAGDSEPRARADSNDSVVRCTMGTSVTFMRQSDCELRGGQAAPTED